MLQEGVPVHHRHHHIQQDQRDAVLILTQDIQRLLTVFRLQNKIIVGKYLVQNCAVELVVFYN